VIAARGHVDLPPEEPPAYLRSALRAAALARQQAARIRAGGLKSQSDAGRAESNSRATSRILPHGSQQARFARTVAAAAAEGSRLSFSKSEKSVPLQLQLRDHPELPAWSSGMLNVLSESSGSLTGLQSLHFLSSELKSMGFSILRIFETKKESIINKNNQIFVTHDGRSAAPYLVLLSNLSKGWQSSSRILKSASVGIHQRVIRLCSLSRRSGISSSCEPGIVRRQVRAEAQIASPRYGPTRPAYKREYVRDQRSPAILSAADRSAGVGNAPTSETTVALPEVNIEALDLAPATDDSAEARAESEYCSQEMLKRSAEAPSADRTAEPARQTVLYSGGVDTKLVVHTNRTRLLTGVAQIALVTNN